jgi:hypothetical protein
VTATAVLRVEVTTPTGRRFVTAASLLAASCVYAEAAGYRLREVWGIPMPDGFHYLTCDNEPQVVPS